MRRVVLLTSLLSLFCCWSAALGGQPQFEPNIVTDPGFEYGANNWSLPGGFSIAGDVCHGGSKSLKVTSSTGAYVFADQYIPVQEGRVYHFSVWVKTQNVTGSGAGISIEWYDSNNSYINSTTCPVRVSGTQDWTQIEWFSNPIESGAKKARVLLSLAADSIGTAWFDDMKGSLVSPENVVINSGFERGNQNWSLSSKFSIASDYKHSGSSSLKVANTDASASAVSYQNIPVVAGISYHFGTWIRTSGVTGTGAGALIRVQWFDAAWNLLGQTASNAKRGSSSWSYIDCLSTAVSSSAAYARIYVGLDSGCTGNAWFDDLDVSIVDSMSNIVRNSGFESGATNWSLPSTFAVVNDVAHSGSNSLRQTNTDGTYQLAIQGVPVEEGKIYHFSAWVKAQSVTGAGASIQLEWNDAAGNWLNSALYPYSITSSPNWTYLEWWGDQIAVGATNSRLYLYLQSGSTGTVWFDDLTVSLEYPMAFDVNLLQPYRGTLYSDSSDKNLYIRANVAKVMPGGATNANTTLRAEVYRNGQQCAVANLSNLIYGTNDLVVPVSTLAAGDYELIVSLVGPNNYLIDRRMYDISIKSSSASKPVAYVDTHKRLIVNGKPFFPIGLFIWSLGSADIATIADSKFNTIMPYGSQGECGTSGTSTANVDASLAQMNSLGLKCMFGLTYVWEGVDYYKTYGFTSEQSVLRNLVNHFKDNPAILGWYLADERPRDWRQRLEDRQRDMRDLDPNHPTWLVNCFGAYNSYLNSSDMHGVDPYCVPNSSLDFVKNWVSSEDFNLGGRFPHWDVLQAFEWSRYFPGQGSSRFPTLDEELVMSYTAIINGSTGLFYFTFNDIQADSLGFDVVWPEMKTVAQEISMLSTGLLSDGSKTPSVGSISVSGGNVEYKTFASDNGTTYLMMCNKSATDSAQVTVTGVPVSRGVSEISRGVLQDFTGTINGSTCVITLPPTRAYTMIVWPSYISVTSISEARNNADHTNVQIVQGKVVTAVYDGAFYIEDGNRATGIKVVSDYSPQVGSKVTLAGTLITVDGERQIEASSVALAVES